MHRAAKLGEQAAGNMTQYLSQSHYHDNTLASPCHILLIPNAKLGSEK